jgi:hypothetical protein
MARFLVCNFDRLPPVGSANDRIDDRSHGTVDGFVYARNHREMPKIVNEPAQSHQPISIMIRSCVDDNVRSIVGIWDDDDRSVISG